MKIEQINWRFLMPFSKWVARFIKFMMKRLIKYFPKFFRNEKDDVLVRPQEDIQIGDTALKYSCTQNWTNPCSGGEDQANKKDHPKTSWSLTFIFWKLVVPQELPISSGLVKDKSHIRLTPWAPLWWTWTCQESLPRMFTKTFIEKLKPWESPRKRSISQMSLRTTRYWELVRIPHISLPRTLKTLQWRILILLNPACS